MPNETFDEVLVDLRDVLQTAIFLEPGGFHREVQHALFKPDLNLFAKV